MKPKDAADSLSNGQDKKERTKCNEHIRMPKYANFTIFSTTLLIGLNIKFYKILLIPCFPTKFLITKAGLCDEHVKL